MSYVVLPARNPELLRLGTSKYYTHINVSALQEWVYTHNLYLFRTRYKPFSCPPISDLIVRGPLEYHSLLFGEDDIRRCVLLHFLTKMCGCPEITGDGSEARQFSLIWSSLLGDGNIESRKSDFLKDLYKVPVKIQKHKSPNYMIDINTFFRMSRPILAYTISLDLFRSVVREHLRAISSGIDTYSATNEGRVAQTRFGVVFSDLIAQKPGFKLISERITNEGIGSLTTSIMDIVTVKKGIWTFPKVFGLPGPQQRTQVRE